MAEAGPMDQAQSFRSDGWSFYNDPLEGYDRLPARS